MSKIENPKTPYQEGFNITEKDYLSSALELEKNLSNNYSIALNEASNSKLYEEFFIFLEDSKDAARECYDLNFKLGWYSIEEAEDTKVQEKITCFEQELQSLDNN